MFTSRYTFFVPFNPLFLFGKSVTQHRPGSILTVPATFPSRACDPYKTNIIQESLEEQIIPKQIQRSVQFSNMFVYHGCYCSCHLSQGNFFFMQGEQTGPFYVILNRQDKKITFPYSCSNLIYTPL